MKSDNKLSASQAKELLNILQTRFEKNKRRHKAIEWDKVQAKLEVNPKKLWSLNEMEMTGGEPDVVEYDNLPRRQAGKTDEYIFCDCAAETPKGRRSICYDAEALASRKEHKPAHSAIGMADEMGIDILTEEQYRELQQLGAFDLKTSSWVLTPTPIRKLGGAIFCDRRYNTVFTYHNGAESYYGARGFRGMLKV